MRNFLPFEKCGWRGFVVLASVLSSIGALAQQPEIVPATEVAPAPVAVPEASPSLMASTQLAELMKRSQPIIRRIYVTDDHGQDSVFQLGNTIALEVEGLNRWMKYQEQMLVNRGIEPKKAHLQARDFVLYIDDAPIIGMPPLAVYADESAIAERSFTDPATAGADSTAEFNLGLRTLLDDNPVGIPDKIVFKLRRDVQNYQYWDVVYASPWQYSHTGKIGLGYDDRIFTDLHPAKNRSIRLELIQPVTLWVAIIGTLLLGIGVLVLGARSWVLRVTPIRPAGEVKPTIAEVHPAYSLAKVQMAWWTFIILGSFLVIYCVSGEMPDISTTSLALLGISSTTTALNAILQPAVPANQILPDPEPSRGWITDILSDEHGLSINRVQQAVIALLMGYFFLRTVYNTVAMPVWTDNQVLLLGISSATYLGLKWQEGRTATANATDGTVPPAVAFGPGPYPGPGDAGGYQGTPGGAAWAAAAPASYGNFTQPAAAFPMPSYGSQTNGAGAYPPPSYGNGNNGAGAYAASPPAYAPSGAGPTSTAAPSNFDNAAGPAPAGPAPYPPASFSSVADPVTGAVLHRQEDDMGPESAADDFVPAERVTEQLPG